MNMKRFATFLSMLILVCYGDMIFSSGPAQDRRAGDRTRQEEKEDYFKNWLNEDVVYIISAAERSVFEELQTAEEKEQFIEQFWFRRDPDRRTAPNEVKQEHYRRIAYANERFRSGMPGWMTDRGRIYIIHGPPAEIESRPSGGTYERPFYEGGGTTVTYPFEIWRYRFIEGIGSDVLLEFVDPSFTDEYRLALHPGEKDALRFSAGVGLTGMELLGVTDDRDRFFQSKSYRNNPFVRHETYTQIQRPAQVKYDDLKSLVEVNIAYENLPVKLRQDYFRLNARHTLVPVTLQLENKDLSFKESNGQMVAKVAVYGIVTSITNRIVSEFEDELVTSLSPESFKVGPSGGALYQKMLRLESRGRYKLDLVVKDLNSSNTGVVRQAIVPPYSKEDDKLAASSLLLSTFVRELEEYPEEDPMFVLGDIRIRPSLDNSFPTTSKMSVYLQLYNGGIDQSTLTPSLGISYRIVRDNGEVAFALIEQSGRSIQFYSPRRIVLIRQFDLNQFSPGKYLIEVAVRDRLKDESIEVTQEFEVVGAE